MNAHDESHPAFLPCERPTRRSIDRAPGGLLSIVVPCHNEEAVVAVTHDRLVGAAQTAAVAIVGEYVVRTYRESQGRPTWVVRRTLNAAASSAPALP